MGGRFARRAECQTARMEIPQYWATASGFSPHLGAEGGELVVWGWSQTSEFDAQGVARSRLAEALERVAVEGGLPDGRGYYPRMPLREPILEEVASSSGHRLGVVTRNRMGCEVLCSDVLFIADVDVPELGGEGDAGGGDTASDGVGGRVGGRWILDPAVAGDLRGPGTHADDHVAAGPPPPGPAGVGAGARCRVGSGLPLA